MSDPEPNPPPAAKPVTVLSYRFPTTHNHIRIGSTRQIRMFAFATYWLILAGCLVWLFGCIAAVVATVVDAFMQVRHLPFHERVAEFRMECLVALPAVMVFILMPLLVRKKM